VQNYTTGSVFSAPAVAYGILYVGSGDSKIYALNVTTGASVWNYTTGNSVMSSPAVADGVLYVGSYDDNVYAINATTGTSVWTYTTGNPVFSSPAVVNGVVYIGSYDDKVYAFGPAHDVAVTNLIPHKTVVGQGYGLKVDITVANKGEYTETFNVTVYASSTFVASQQVTLSSTSSLDMTVTWNTTTLGYGNYTISAYAWPVPGETNTANNNMTGGTVYVGIPGDVNGDGTVNELDAVALKNAFDATPGSPNWNPNADINGDGIVDIYDAVILSSNYGQSIP
jgi:hypothetical protein